MPDILSPIVTRSGDNIPSTVLRKVEEWGLVAADLVNPPPRFWGDQETPLPLVEASVDARRLRPVPSPAELIDSLPPGDSWPAQSRRSLGRLWAYYLVCEDPQRRLDVRSVNTLSHQVSLVQHVLQNENLRRVLIADEVGLGKTVEAGLLLKQLLERNPSLRILYLAPARLVSNVRREFERLNLSFRQWSSGDGDARLTDPRIIGSIHRAVHGKHRDSILETERWDVIVVDECHHLSDWSPGGGSPTQKFRLVRDLIERQAPDGRVLFLSGTPHQGSIARFDNLLGLLRRPGEADELVSGRVIYRTKEDVRDWEGRPLFPQRQVNEPLVLELSREYLGWLKNIHEFFRPNDADARRSQATDRAAGWRCAQAKQWAVSSPQAGLGYLVRQALRAGWELDNATLADAIAALRPYRSGKVDEPVPDLFKRLKKEVEQQTQEADVEDIEDETEYDAGKVRDRDLERLLVEGIQVLRSFGDYKWRIVKDRLLDSAGDEKVVLFAQPIETVIALARFLENATGERPALIIGGQTDAERSTEVDRFWLPSGPRFLVSSKAGGEGINLQIARRLVHIDIPWNPMDLEQRVGRVHRFGSRDTIIVDTVVVKDSREADAYKVARDNLQRIVSTLVDPEKFEAVFSRVMCLIPPEEFQDVLNQGSIGPLPPEQQEAISSAVRAGFRAWREFDDRFAEQQRQIAAQDPGLATWEDLMQFLVTYAGAQPVEGYNVLRFGHTSGKTEPVDSRVSALRLPDGGVFICEDTGGSPVFGKDGKTARQLGLNSRSVAKAIRDAALPTFVGAAHLRWPRDRALPVGAEFPAFGVLIIQRQTIQPDIRANYVQLACTFHCYILNRQNTIPVLGGNKKELVRGLTSAVIARVPPNSTDPLLRALKESETSIANELRRPTAEEIHGGIRHAVLPLFAALVTKHE